MKTQTITQYIQSPILQDLKKIVLVILIALYEGLSRYGCGLAGIPYEDH
jgi:hypothetical protein